MTVAVVFSRAAHATLSYADEQVFYVYCRLIFERLHVYKRSFVAVAANNFGVIILSPRYPEHFCTCGDSKSRRDR
jgi:hypothetical protein